ncbi:MAG: adenylate/guanylate cyclase domain-containing protein [Deltaproteobacteria bacterium]|nr:adenylate/guanylate cyclase domain-containing protein [Deltaproteobacteria bacterium]
MAKIIYEDEKDIEEELPQGSLLKIALKNGIQHLHACGGVARCTTCKVEVLESPENLTPPTRVEEKFAAEYELPANIRLACQAQPTGDVRVRRMIKEDLRFDDVKPQAHLAIGQAIPMAVLFSDIRDFTVLTQSLPPHDTIHALNRYFHLMGDVIIKNNGYIHQYYGDGLMALFGFYAREPTVICMDAVIAAMEMLDKLKIFNEFMFENFNRKIKIGVGIHFGEVVSAKIGHPKHKQLTVMGDVVNMAARVEATTKSTDSPLVISSPVFGHLGPTIVRANSIHVDLKGIGIRQLYEVTGFAPGFQGAAHRFGHSNA